ncbi:antibiotic transport system ATP-binding protein [Spiroplasma syrphidicola EA-1]|uniref:Antibiotic transport system ATP-binding protein n=1 Tax=Spiroplasma syrphidicola EA-1 TaxID=1276229 RepID=R4U6P3_9MOLU|nr:ABC transporter ATP-binding protein [Spiroplasma syrphidicola]AGM26288.1 antibiotic transport system ATP-binding protein [Spiroplasma syrphidicola EA-1]
MNVIELKNLTKIFDFNTGAFDISIDVKQGEVYGFIGPNGAGKTTVIRQMIGFIKSDSGTGQILGHDIWKNSNTIMKDLGYLSGEIFLPDFMIGFAYLKLLSEIRGNVDWHYVLKLVNYFELDANTKIKKMSKGMKQKVAIIAAFMHKPKVLVLDEPTSGLDPLMQQKFNNLIQELKSHGTSVFMSSHIFGEIDNLCDKVGVIKKGKMVSEISMEEAKNNSEKKYEIKFFTEEDYNNFIKTEWNILEQNNVTRVTIISVHNEKVNNFLKFITEYRLEYFKEIPFNLEEFVMKYYQDEVKFND